MLGFDLFLGIYFDNECRFACVCLEIPDDGVRLKLGRYY
jgi:hypothetical protein